MEKLLTIQELSDRIGLTVGTIYSFISKKRIPVTKVGNKVMFSPSLVQEWLNKNTTGIEPKKENNNE